MFSNLKFEDLDCAFDSENFGPQGKTMDFSDQFDGKLFKPYNKRDKIGKFCEFSTMSMNTAMPAYTRQSMIN